jgi:hypothetical protein
MTLVAATLFITALLLSIYTVLMTVARAMPRIEQVFAERNVVVAPPRMIRLGEVRRTSAIRQQAVIMPFAPRAPRHSYITGYAGATEPLKLAA